MAVFAALVAAFGISPPPSVGELTNSKLGKSRGCQDSLTELARETPGWVSIDPSDPQVVVEGMVHHSKMANVDFPFSHDSHDFNFHVVPDPAYESRMSDANEIVGGKRLMEMEWESKYFPMAYWPVEGDRVFVRGRWIFDCGHPEDGRFYTELHPVSLVASTRYQPYQFGMEVVPSHSNLTYIYANGQGGYYTTKVAGQDYVFNVPVPPKPSPNATLETKVVFPGNPAPILTPKIVNGVQMVEVRLPFANLPDPGSRWWLHEWIMKRRIAIATGKPAPAMDRPKNTFSYAAVVASRWKEPTLSKGFRMLRVTFENMKVHNDHDTFAGEWNVFLRANEKFFQVPEKSVDDGDTITINQGSSPIVAEDGVLRIEMNGWEDDYDSYFRVGMPPGAFDLFSLNSNESLGKVDVRFTAANNFGVGRHSIKSSNGDSTLNFRIEEVKRFPAGTSTVRESYTATIKSIKAVVPDAKTPTVPVTFTMSLAEGSTTKTFNATVGQPTPVPGAAATGSVEATNPSMLFRFDSRLPALIKNRGSKLPPEVIARPIKIFKYLTPGTYKEVVTSEGQSSMEIEFVIAKARTLPTRFQGILARPGTLVKPPAAGGRPPAATARPPGQVKPPGD